MKCLNCEKETNNPKFCSKSCSAIVNGTLYAKRKLKRECATCGVKIVYDRKFCKNCFTKRLNMVPNTKLKDMKFGDTRVRQHARAVAAKAGLLEKCYICGYTFIVECCHIKPVRDFTVNTKIKVINDLHNLIGLCPNHHMEFDAGILQIQP